MVFQSMTRGTRPLVEGGTSGGASCQEAPGNLKDMSAVRQTRTPQEALLMVRKGQL